MPDSVWDTYPADYRAAEVRAILAAARAGESVSLLGLSGAGKSNLTGFLAQRQSTPEHPMILVDGNRLAEPTPPALFRHMRRALGETETALDEWDALDLSLTRRLNPPVGSLTLIFDRFDALVAQPALFHPPPA
jgi:ABC-type glutathione transport system ATPase component